MLDHSIIMKYLQGKEGKSKEGKEDVKDLGIIFEHIGKFDNITSVVGKGSCMVGWILWRLKTRTNK